MLISSRINFSVTYVNGLLVKEHQGFINIINDSISDISNERIIASVWGHQVSLERTNNEETDEDLSDIGWYRIVYQIAILQMMFAIMIATIVLRMKREKKSQIVG